MSVHTHIHKETANNTYVLNSQSLSLIRSHIPFLKWMHTARKV